MTGSSVNHDAARANTKVVKIDDTEVHGVATKDIKEGEELLCDYVMFGEPPSWLVSFSHQHGITLPFRGYNQFIE